MNKKTTKLLFFVVILFIIGIVVASIYWHGDTLYQGAYAPVVEKSLERKQEVQQEEGESNQPAAPGFREKDIDRQKGDGFSTY